MKTFWNKYKDTIIRYAISTGVTFLSGFLGSLLLTLDSVKTYEDFKISVLTGALFAGFRLVVKSSYELINDSITKK